MLTLIRRQTAHLTRLLDDLLDVVRITSGRIELRWQPVDLREAVRLAYQSERARFEAKGKPALLLRDYADFGPAYEIDLPAVFRDTAKHLNALVAAATLSDRYIGDRFLPDKAIDLVDEAASRLRIEIDSLPQEIDEVERRIVQLEIQLAALTKEKDKAGVERRKAVEQEIAAYFRRF